MPTIRPLSKVLLGLSSEMPRFSFFDRSQRRWFRCERAWSVKFRAVSRLLCGCKGARLPITFWGYADLRPQVALWLFVSTLRTGVEFKNASGETMVKLVVRDRESIQEAVRRFRKLVERSGIKKEMRRREYYEKPSETKRRSRLRAERRGRRSRLLSV